MNKLTYKEFKKIINDMGYKVWLDYEDYIKVTNGNEATIAVVHKKQYKVLSLDWVSYTILTDDERDLLADACWALASTPLEDREEPKKYYLKVKPRYNHLFSYGTYFNYNRDNDNICMTNEDEDLFWQTKFTAEECESLEKRYDLTILERVLVEED